MIEVLIALAVLLAGSALVVWLPSTKWGDELWRKSIRRSRLRDMRKNRKQRPVQLSHLTDEQWQCGLQL